MAKTIAFDLNLNVGDTEKKIQEFISSTDLAKTKLKELERAAIEASINGNKALSETFAKAAGELKDEIEDTRQSINNFSSDTQKLDVAVGAVQGLVGGFTAVAGAVGLLSGENEDLQRTIVFVTSSMAVLNGIQQVSVTLNKSSATGAALYAAANKVLNFSIKETAASLGVLKTALIATGIGAAVVAVGFLVANFEELKEMISGVSEATTKLKEAQSIKVGVVESEYNALVDNENVLRLQGKTQREILLLKLESLRLVIAEQEQLLSLEKQERENYIKSKERLAEKIGMVQSFLDKTSKFYEIIPDSLDAQGGTPGGGLLQKGLAAVKPDVEAEKKKADDEIKAQQDKLNKLKNDLAGFQLAIKELDSKAAVELLERRKKEDQTLLEKEKEAASQRQAVRDAEIRAIKDADEKEIALFNEKYKREIEAAGTNNELVMNLMKAFEIESQQLLDKQAKDREVKQKAEADKELAIIKKKYDDKLGLISTARLKQEQFNKDAGLTENGELPPEQVQFFNNQELEILQAQFDAKLITEEDYYNKKKALDTAYYASVAEMRRKDEEQQKRLEDFKVNTVATTFGILSDLNASFANNNEKNAKRAFENNKKLQIAETLIQTYVATQAAFAQAQKNPISIIGPAYPYIQAGLALSAGLARVARIKSTQFNSTGTSDSGGTGATPGGVNTPTLNNPFSSQGSSSVINPELRPRGEKDVRVYVLESDISTTQRRVSVIENNSNASF